MTCLHRLAAPVKYLGTGSQGGTVANSLEGPFCEKCSGQKKKQKEGEEDVAPGTAGTWAH